MGLPNLKLRGGSYHWRRKITVAGTALPLCLSLRTGNYQRARCMAERLGSAVENLRMAYGQSTGMAPDHLKQVFSDALRWQLGRILEDQAGSVAPPEDHATINTIYAEAWSFLEREGTKACWTIDDHDRLIRTGWDVEGAKAVAKLVFDLQLGEPVSKVQLQSYAEAFGLALTKDNVARLARVICSARAAACREASARLPSFKADDDDSARKIAEALADDTPFTFKQSLGPSTPDTQPAKPVPRQDVTAAALPQSSISVHNKKRVARRSG